MNYIKSENYLCFLTLLEMILSDSQKSLLTQYALAEKFGITVPPDYTTTLKNVTFSSNPRDLGVQITKSRLETFFQTEDIPMDVGYYDGSTLNEFTLDTQLKEFQDSDKYAIFTISYGSLYGKIELLELGHAILLVEVNNDDTVTIYDPGPKDSGLKDVKIDDLCVAMRSRGGIFTFR